MIPPDLIEEGPIPDAEGVCPFMRAFLNHAARADAGGIVLTTLCDQIRRGAERLDDEGKVFLFNLPVTWETPEATGLYVSELHRLGRFLVPLGGDAPSPGELGRIMLERDAARGTQEPVESRPDGIPVALLGGALTAHDRGILELVAKLGGRVVLDGTEAGERTRPARFDRRRIQDDPLGELAEAYFGSIPEVFRRPNSMLYQWLEQAIEEREPRGVILLRQVWCDLWHGEVERLREWLDIPLLDLDLNGHDPVARSRTRVQAFLETLR